MFREIVEQHSREYFTFGRWLTPQVGKPFLWLSHLDFDSPQSAAEAAVKHAEGIEPPITFDVYKCVTSVVIGTVYVPEISP